MSDFTKIFITGGISPQTFEQTYFNQFFTYDCKADKLTKEVDHHMITKRSCHATCIVKKKGSANEYVLYAVGGCDSKAAVQAERITVTVNENNYTLGEWSPIKSDLFLRKSFALVGDVNNECLYAYGGFTEDSEFPSTALTKYNIKNDTWEKIDTSNGEKVSPLYSIRAAINNEMIYFVGSRLFNGGIVTELQTFDIQQNAWLKPKTFDGNAAKMQMYCFTPKKDAFYSFFKMAIDTNSDENENIIKAFETFYLRDSNKRIPYSFVDNKEPHPCCFSTISCFQRTSGGVWNDFVIFGGFNGKIIDEIQIIEEKAQDVFAVKQGQDKIPTANASSCTLN